MMKLLCEDNQQLNPKSWLNGFTLLLLPFQNILVKGAEPKVWKFVTFSYVSSWESTQGIPKTFTMISDLNLNVLYLWYDFSWYINPFNANI